MTLTVLQIYDGSISVLSVCAKEINFWDCNIVSGEFFKMLFGENFTI